MNTEMSYYHAKSCGLIDAVLRELEVASEFGFTDIIEIQDILQKDESVFFTIPRTYVREWFVRKIEQRVNSYDDVWFEEVMR